MSTATNAPTSQRSFSVPSAQERPRLTATFVIEGVGDPKTTNSGDYEMADIIVRHTRSSRKFFPRLMFREEMFSVGLFSEQDYLNFQKYPSFAEQGSKGKPKGESYLAIYRMHVCPSFALDKNGKAKRYEVTPTVAIAGGQLENFLGPLAGAFAAALDADPSREKGPFGYARLSATEIVDVLRKYIASNPKVEQAAILKQSTDQSGALTDNYEVATWRGPFTTELHESLTAQAAKANDKATSPGKRLEQGYI